MRNRLGVKGISLRENKNSTTYQAYVTIKNNGGKSDKSFKAHVGTYPTLEQAVLARFNFIINLK